MTVERLHRVRNETAAGGWVIDAAPEPACLAIGRVPRGSHRLRLQATDHGDGAGGSWRDFYDQQLLNVSISRALGLFRSTPAAYDGGDGPPVPDAPFHAAANSRLSWRPGHILVGQVLAAIGDGNAALCHGVIIFEAEAARSRASPLTLFGGMFGVHPRALAGIAAGRHDQAVRGLRAWQARDREGQCK